MNEKKGTLLVLMTAIISGLAIFISRFGVQVINPYIFTGLKNIMTVFWLLVVILLIGEWRQLRQLSAKQWRTLFIIGLVGGSIPFLLFFKGLSMSTGAEASFIHKTMFLPVVLMAWFFLKEKINKGLLLGVAFLLLGNILLLKITANAIWDRGDLLILMATLFWACEQIISKKAVATISPRIVALGRLGIGFGFILIFWFATGQINLLGDLTFHQFSWVWLTAIILLGYVLTWYTGLKYVRVSKATCILALGAPITTLLSLAQGQAVTLPQAIGLASIVLGLVFILGLKKFVYVRT